MQNKKAAASRKAAKQKNKGKPGRIFLTIVCVLLTGLTVAAAIKIGGLSMTSIPIPLVFSDDWNKQEKPNGNSSIANLPTIIPESNRADKSYLDQITFLGDSLSVGMVNYNYLPQSQVFALAGLNHTDAKTKRFISFGSSSKKYTMAEAVAKTKPQKIIIMLGINGIAWMDKTLFLSDYDELVGSIQKAAPDAIIVLESMLPVTASYTAQEPRITNAKIKEYNKGILEIAKKRKLHYLDTTSAFQDKNGAMPAQYSADGLHINQDGYDRLFDYILTHPF